MKLILIALLVGLTFVACGDSKGFPVSLNGKAKLETTHDVNIRVSRLTQKAISDLMGKGSKGKKLKTYAKTLSYNNTTYTAVYYMEDGLATLIQVTDVNSNDVTDSLSGEDVSGLESVLATECVVKKDCGKSVKLD